MRKLVSKISLTGLLLLLVATAWGAGKVSFEASSPLTVAVGEAFRVEFSLNASPDDDTFRAPSFEGFDVLAGPAVSRGSSVQIVNGSMTRSVNVTYTFVLLPQAAGNVTIGAAEVAVDGTVYRTDPLPVEIVDEGQAASQSPQQTPQSRRWCRLPAYWSSPSHDPSAAAWLRCTGFVRTHAGWKRMCRSSRSGWRPPSAAG